MGVVKTHSRKTKSGKRSVVRQHVRKNKGRSWDNAEARVILSDKESFPSYLVEKGRKIAGLRNALVGNDFSNTMARKKGGGCSSAEWLHNADKSCNRSNFKNSHTSLGTKAGKKFAKKS